MDKLKPCPFCGEDKLQIQSDWTDFAHPTAYHCFVLCQTCYASGPEFEEQTSLEDVKDKAITAWNTRPGVEQAVGDGTT